MTDRQMFDAATTKYFIPNWFTKQHFESFIGKQISDDDWHFFLINRWDALGNYISEVVEEFAIEIADEYFGGE